MASDIKNVHNETKVDNYWQQTLNMLPKKQNKKKKRKKKVKIKELKLPLFFKTIHTYICT